MYRLHPTIELKEEISGDLAKKLQREEEENEMNNKTNINSNLALGDSTDNDAVIAKLLQRQLDREYNAELKAAEKMINKNSKICYNYDNFRLDDDSSSEYESETELVEIDGTFVSILMSVEANIYIDGAGPVMGVRSVSCLRSDHAYLFIWW